MKRVLLLACLHFCPMSIALAADAAPPPAEKVEALPVEALSELTKAMRALQLVQDRMATGNAVAVEAQRALLEQMPQKGMSTAQPDAPMLALALLNGADPAQFGYARRAAETDPMLAGAFAFAQGRQAAAAASFAKVDAAALPHSVRAQYWLVLGSLLAERDPKAAVSALANARLQAPGTLIEEAALRRETHLRSDDAERMMSLASAYLRRFGQSPFASAFVTQFAFSIAAAPPDVQERVGAMLDDVLAQARSEDRQGFYTLLARKTLIGGNHELARMASLRAVEAEKGGSSEFSARLYRAALAIAAQDPGNAAQELHSLMRAPLQPSDLEILRAAISVARELRRWPYDEQPPGEGAPPTGSDAPGMRQPPVAQHGENTVIMQQAADLIRSTDTLVGRP